MDNDAKKLVAEAFEGARKANKPDWYRMTSAVLKNRLMALRKSFDLRDFGVETFPEFIRLCDELVEYDPTTKPPTVTFKLGSPPQPAAERWSVRYDLWKALTDYTSGVKYLWDPATGVAREVTEDDDKALVLPTITPNDLASWRAAFFEQHQSTLDSHARERLRRWRDEGLQLRALPQALQTPWHAGFRDHVVDRIRVWFAQKQLDMPDVREDGATAAPPTNVAALRRLIVRVVHVMTQRELEDLRLPAGATHRALKKTTFTD